MASNSRNSSKGIEGATLSRRSSKSKSSSMVAAGSKDAPAKWSRLPNEGLDGS